MINPVSEAKARLQSLGWSGTETTEVRGERTSWQALATNGTRTLLAMSLSQADAWEVVVAHATRLSKE